MAWLLLILLLPAVMLLLGMAVGWAFDGTLLGVAVGSLAAVVAALFAARSLRDAAIRVVRVLQGREVLGERELALLPQRTPLDDAVAAAAAAGLAARSREADLRRQLAHLTVALDRLPDGLLLVSDDGLVTWANVASAALLGGRDPVGATVMAAGRDFELAQAVRRALETGDDQRLVLQPPGEGRALEALVMRLAAEPPEALVVLRDITELQRLRTLRRDFVANVSHELRTPLTTVKVLAESLLDLRPNDREAAQMLESIVREVDEMAGLVRDLLELARLESEASLSLRQVDAAQLVHDVTQRLAPHARRKGITLAVEAEPVTLVADERRLHQALLNLVSNALHHTPEGGRVEVRVTAEDGEAAFVVRDTGPGIPREEQARIFERFYKVDRSRTTGGTGLGLAIVKHVALAHGGSVSVDSVPGEGATFTLRVPLRPAGELERTGAGAAR